MNLQTQANGGNSDHDDTAAVAYITRLLSEDSAPKLLKQSAGGESCCVFRIPQSLAQIHQRAYEPKIVSIGPYHHAKEHLLMIQEHKRRFLKFFVAKMEENGIDGQELVVAVSRLEENIRASYSESLVELDRQKLIDMMVLDGCFILTLFLVVSRKVVYTDFDDPIFRMPWLLPSIRSDLLLLENQVPLFLLQTLLQKSNLGRSCGLNEIAFEFFGYSIDRPEECWTRHYNLEAKHLLDLIRKTFIPLPSQDTPKQSCLTIICCSKERSRAATSSDSRPFLKSILSAKKLHLRGIKFKVRKNTSTFLDIRLDNGVLHIPPLAMDDFIVSIFLNCVAFEQLYADSSPHITSYVAFMSCLINDEADAAFLGEKGS